MEKIGQAIMIGFGLIMGLWFSGFSVLFSNNPHGFAGNALAAGLAIFLNVFAFIGLDRFLGEKSLTRLPMIAAIVAIVVAFALRIAGVLPTH